MSETDPYAAKSVEDEVQAPVEDAPVEAPEAPVTEKLVVPEGSVKKVLDWVSDDATRAKAALDAENKGEKRSSLITKLNAILD
jgi:hypothetical protein